MEAKDGGSERNWGQGGFKDTCKMQDPEVGLEVAENDQGEKHGRNPFGIIAEVSAASLHRCPMEMQRQSWRRPKKQLEWPGKAGTQQASASRTESPWRGSEGSQCQGAGRGHIGIIFLMGGR